MMKFSQFIKKFFILSIILCLSNSQIKVPLKYFPIYIYNDTTPSQIMQNLILMRLYANIDMGTPRTTIQIPLYFESNEFFICQISKKEFGTELFSDMKLFNNSNSMIETDEGNYEISGYFFNMAYSYNDTFYINNQKYEMPFYLPIDTDEKLSGGIGMQLNSYHNFGDDSTTPIEKSFIGYFKSKKIINDYHYSIFYNSKINSKEEEGFLLIGSLPHELNTDLGYYNKDYFIENNKRTVNLKVSGNIIENIMEMDKVLAYEGNNKDKLIEDFPNTSFDYLKVKFDYNSGGVKAPKGLQKYYQRVFEEYINKTECFYDSFKKNSYYFYYCKNNKDTISKIKSVFPGIIFRSNDFETSFTLDADDLFIEENNYVFCLIYFTTSSGISWILGKPFLKKYQFSFNYESKYITFYKENEQNKGEINGPNNGISPTVLWIVVCATVVIVSVICFIIFKYYLHGKLFKKKRANELEDSDYDYTPKRDDEEKHSPINE